MDKISCGSHENERKGVLEEDNDKGVINKTNVGCAMETDNNTFDIQSGPRCGLETPEIQKKGPPVLMTTLSNE